MSGTGSAAHDAGLQVFSARAVRAALMQARATIQAVPDALPPGAPRAAGDGRAVTAAR